MTTYAEEHARLGAQMAAAGEELKRRGLPWTAEYVAMVVNEDPTEGRYVAGLVMTPKRPDGSGGEVEKIIGMRGAREEYAEVDTSWIGDNVAQVQASPFAKRANAGGTLSAVRKKQLQSEVAALRGQLASGSLTPAERIRCEQSLKTMLEVLDGHRPDPDPTAR